MKGADLPSLQPSGAIRPSFGAARSLAGIVHSSRPDARAELALMGRSLTYGDAKPVDAFHDRELGLALTGSADPSQALITWNAARTIGFALTGEIFSLQHENGTIVDQPALDLLIEAYAQRGVRAIARYNGWFSLVIIDRRSEQVILCNDRYGLGRIYWHNTATGFYFASEAKALLAVLPGTRHPDPKGLAEFLSNGCVLQNRSLYAGIELLPGGSCWTYERGRLIGRERYFDPADWEAAAPLTSSDYVEQLAQVLSRVVRRYLANERGVAMSLTGGLDSRMVLAWGRPAAGTLPCYTFGGPIRDCADVRIARELARVSKQSHQTLHIENDFFRDFLTLAQQNIHATDGNMDVSGTVEIYMNRRARAIAPIRLTGNYGSEILRANVAFRPRRLDRTLFAPEFLPRLDEARETYAHEAKTSRLAFIAFKQVSWHHFARFAAERSQLTPRSPFLDNELVELAFRIPRILEGSPLPLLDVITRGNPELDTVRTDRALRATPGLLGRVQREWQEFTAKAEYAYDYGMPQWLARTDRLLKPLHLERLFLGRHKFYHFRTWYRDSLATALREGNFTRPLPCFRDDVPRTLIQEHTSGARNWTLEIHQLLTVQLIDRYLADIACRT